MAETLNNKQKREWAELLYTQHNFSQKEIATKVGTSEKQISRWKNQYSWEGKRKSLLTSKESALQTLYDTLDLVMAKIRDTNGGIGDTSLADMTIKYGSAIEKLEVETSIGQKIEAYMALIRHIALTDLDFANQVTSWVDDFINTLLQNKK